VLGVSVRRVRALIAEKKLIAHRVGRDYAIEEQALKNVKVYGKSGRPKKETNGKRIKQKILSLYAGMTNVRAEHKRSK
jgi:excisionase family DNA binding protein